MTRKIRGSCTVVPLLQYESSYLNVTKVFKDLMAAV